MADSPFDLWAYLSTTPLLWLTVTLGVWVGADRLAAWSGRHPLVNPVLLSILVVAVVLALTATPYAVYFEGAQFVHFLLGPATVALAVPLYRARARVRRSLLPIVVALVAGSLTAILSAVGVGMALGLPHEALVALAPKSATAPVAMGIAEALGGDPALTAVLVILTGILGAIVVTPLMNRLGIRDYAARGFAVGLASHGIGTARAFSVDSLAGTFAGIAMAMNAVATALIAPLVIRALGL
ncbi:LrgB family protein [Pseudoxanthobacter sp. M-2]|uniref:LrgB family protein n=1 Tax=Pseudoxanthobacter sp. M-2 TaxID=3078754 RepID=UPI0038FC1D85